MEDGLGAEIIEHFHLFVKGFGGNSEKAFEAVGRILEGNPQVIILCDEIGCGIVPMEKEEREFESVATGEETKERNFELEKELLKHVMDKAKKIYGLFVYGSNKCD